MRDYRLASGVPGVQTAVELCLQTLVSGAVGEWLGTETAPERAQKIAHDAALVIHRKSSI